MNSLYYGESKNHLQVHLTTNKGFQAIYFCFSVYENTFKNYQIIALQMRYSEGVFWNKWDALIPLPRL